jgi:hypothetical protein
MKPIFILALILLTAGTGLAGPIEDMPANSWYEVPNSNMRTVCPPSDSTDNRNCANVIGAWSGGAFDTKRDRLIVHGGGHADSPDNIVYVFDLATFQWSRASKLSPSFGGDCNSGVYPDGQPRAVHSYNIMQYLENIDRFCRFSGPALYPSGNCTEPHVWCLDLDSGEWERKQDCPQKTGVSSMSAYHSLTGALYLHGTTSSSKLQKWTPQSDSWAIYSTNPFGGGTSSMTADIDLVRNKMVVVGRDRATKIWHLDHPDVTPVAENITTTGDKTLETITAPGFAYHPPSGLFYGWGTGKTVYTFDLGSRVWTAINPSGDNPGSPTQWGTFGRFRYSPNKNVFALVNNVDANVFIYKPDGTSINHRYVPGDLSPRLRVHPNPCHTSAIICYYGSFYNAKIEIGIFSIDGKQIDRFDVQAGDLKAGIEWNAAGITPGIYLIRLEAGSTLVQKRILILN